MVVQKQRVYATPHGSKIPRIKEMASTDMRIDVNFVDHPKTKRLIRKAGYEAFYCLIKLFSSVAKAYPKGELTGCDQYDIENLADWRGESGVLFDALTDPDFCFIERVGDHWHVHEWDIHQPWVFNSKERSEIARQNVKKRWDKSQNQYEPNTNGIQTVIRNRYESLTQNTPSPSPSPIDKDKNPQDAVASIPKGKTRFKKPTVEKVKEYCVERDNTVDPQYFIDYYESIGWKIGKNPMKDWKATIRRWEKNSDSNKPNGSRQTAIRQDAIVPARSIFDDLRDEQEASK